MCVCVCVGGGGGVVANNKIEQNNYYSEIPLECQIVWIQDRTEISPIYVGPDLGSNCLQPT